MLSRTGPCGERPVPRDRFHRVETGCLMRSLRGPREKLSGTGPSSGRPVPELENGPVRALQEEEEERKGKKEKEKEIFLIFFIFFLVGASWRGKLQSSLSWWISRDRVSHVGRRRRVVLGDDPCLDHLWIVEPGPIGQAQSAVSDSGPVPTGRTEFWSGR
uniref:Uncharacterized protein n=1 Tax=Ananas comosus var. bracteatus TaxID=296719 RepID=A0A6V7P2G2_ANACO|nr:unnamed protein product [Ananas comosus var. bracteatus]